MFELFKKYCNKTSFCGSKWFVEPKYRLFYINEHEQILTCKFPVNVVQLEMHRPHGEDIFVRNVFDLSPGDIFKVTIRNYDVKSKMSPLERACAITIKYIRYNGKENFERLNYKKIGNTLFIRLY